MCESCGCIPCDVYGAPVEIGTSAGCEELLEEEFAYDDDEDFEDEDEDFDDELDDEEEEEEDEDEDFDDEDDEEW